MDEYEFRISLGHGKIQNPLAKHDPIELYLIPEFSYYGERFYVENFVMGYSLVETEHFIFDAYGYLNRDGYYFELNKLEDFTVSNVLGTLPQRPAIDENGNIVPPPEVDRNLSYMAGVHGQFDWHNTYVKFGIAQDVSGVHNGSEMKLTLGQHFNFGNFYGSADVYVVNKSARLLNYYYGLHPNEFTRSEQPVTDSSDFNKGVRIALGYRINEQWSINVIGEKQWLSDAIYNSALINTQQVHSWFTGVTYTF